MPHETTPVAWPALPSREWTGTLETVHLWSQIVGKIRMSQMPWLNHSWSVPLYVTASGLSTSLVPWGTEGFELKFDFLRDELRLSTTTGERRSIELRPRTVADFYRAVLAEMSAVGMPVEIHPIPNELVEVIPFPDDTVHQSYDGDQIRALWRAFQQTSRVLTRFRAGWLGKASPVHFFWGSFDLAVTRFSGRPAPAHPGGVPNLPNDVAREAYSHEVTSCGFWPGNREAPDPIFYAYAYPAPEGFSKAPVKPEGAVWYEPLGEFVLPYESVRGAKDPDSELMSFLESTHAAAADLAGWERDSLECSDPHGPDWWQTRSRRRSDQV